MQKTKNILLLVLVSISGVAQAEMPTIKSADRKKDGGVEQQPLAPGVAPANQQQPSGTIDKKVDSEHSVDHQGELQNTNNSGLPELRVELTEGNAALSDKADSVVPVQEQDKKPVVADVTPVKTGMPVKTSDTTNSVKEENKESEKKEDLQNTEPNKGMLANLGAYCTGAVGGATAAVVAHPYLATVGGVAVVAAVVWTVYEHNAKRTLKTLEQELDELEPAA